MLKHLAATKNSENTIQALTFMSDVFCEKENKNVYYRITSSFYNCILRIERYLEQYKDGLMYPSANTEKSGANLVLKRGLIDNGTLHCTHAVLYAIQRMPNNPKQLNIGPSSFEDVIPEADGTLRFTKVV
jgi:hypothetical protein